MSVTPGKMLAGINIHFDKTAVPASENERGISIYAKDLDELRISKPPSMCLGITTDDNKIFVWLNNNWVPAS